MTIRPEHDPIAQRAIHRISFTNGAEQLSMAADSTQAAYLVEGPRGAGFDMYFEFNHKHSVSSTAAAESFITGPLGGTIP